MRTAMSRMLVLALFVILPMGAGQGQEPQQATLAVGRVTIAAIKGEVAIHAADGAALPSQQGQLLTPGAVVETRKGSIVLNLPDGSQAQVKGNSRVELKDPAKEGGFSLELFLGKVITKIKKKLGEEPSFRLGTPTAVITVRGTEFMTDVDKKGKTSVYVYEGVVEVAGLVPGSRPVFVRPGFWTEVPPHRPAREPGPIDLNDRMMRGSQADDRSGAGSSSDSNAGQRSSDAGGRQQQPQQPSQQTSGEHEKPD